MKKFICVIGLILSLAGCSLFSPVKDNPPAAYELSRIPHSFPHKKKHAISILVLVPDQVPAYNTSAMAYTMRPYEIAYYSQSRWSETPAQMLQPLMIQTLQNTHYFRAVLSPPFGGLYDYLLTTQIVKLEQSFIQQPATLVFVVRAQLNHVTTNRVVATKEFYVTQRMAQNNAYSGVQAANRATEILLRRLAEFCVEYAR